MLLQFLFAAKLLLLLRHERKVGRCEAQRVQCMFYACCARSCLHAPPSQLLRSFSKVSKIKNPLSLLRSLLPLPRGEATEPANFFILWSRSLNLFFPFAFEGAGENGSFHLAAMPLFAPASRRGEKRRISLRNLLIFARISRRLPSSRPYRSAIAANALIRDAGRSILSSLLFSAAATERQEASDAIRDLRNPASRW